MPIKNVKGVLLSRLDQTFYHRLRSSPFVGKTLRSQQRFATSEKSCWLLTKRNDWRAGAAEHDPVAMFCDGKVAKCQYLCATSEWRTGTGLPLDRYMQKSCDLPLYAEVFGLLAIYHESVLILYDTLHYTVRRNGCGLRVSCARSRRSAVVCVGGTSCLGRHPY